MVLRQEQIKIALPHPPEVQLKPPPAPSFARPTRGTVPAGGAPEQRWTRGTGGPRVGFGPRGVAGDPLPTGEGLLSTRVPKRGHARPKKRPAAEWSRHGRAEPLLPGLLLGTRG